MRAIVSQSPHMCACDGVSAFPMSYLPLSPMVTHCLPTCVPVLDGVSAFPTSCLPLSPIVSPHAYLCWIVCPPSRGLVSPWLPLSPLVYHCLPLSPIVSLLVSPLPPSRCLVSPLSPIVSLRVSVCWMVCLPSQGFVSLSPNLSFFLVPFGVIKVS